MTGHSAGQSRWRARWGWEKGESPAKATVSAQLGLQGPHQLEEASWSEERTLHGFTEEQTPPSSTLHPSDARLLSGMPRELARGQGVLPQPCVPSAVHCPPSSAHPGAHVLRAFAEAIVKLATKISLTLRGISPCLRSLLFWFCVL